MMSGVILGWSLPHPAMPAWAVFAHMVIPYTKPIRRLARGTRDATLGRRLKTHFGMHNVLEKRGALELYTCNLHHAQYTHSSIYRLSTTGLAGVAVSRV